MCAYLALSMVDDNMKYFFEIERITPRSAASAIFTAFLCASAFNFGALRALGFGLLPITSNASMLFLALVYGSFLYVFGRLLFGLYQLSALNARLVHNKILKYVILNSPTIVIIFNFWLVYSYIDFAVIKDKHTIMLLVFMLLVATLTLRQPIVRRVPKRFTQLWISLSMVSIFYLTGVVYISIIRHHSPRVNIFIDGEVPRVGSILFPAGEGYVVFFPGDQYYRYIPARRINEIGAQIPDL